MMDWITKPCATPCEASRQAAREHQQNLTKPPGSLGQLEEIAVSFAGWQGKTIPSLSNVVVHVFAGDHGVCDQGVSAFPAEVTVQMIQNFVSGGAAISLLSREQVADFAVINMGTREPTPAASGLVNVHAAPGTLDFSTQEAMTDNILQVCLATGREQIDKMDGDLFIAGDMGIGNTCSSSAIVAALLKLPAEAVAGRGTGIDDAGLQRKQAAIRNALDLHREQLNSPLNVLRCLGGLEIAAIAGAFIRSAQRGIPVLLDGFVVGAAALAATRINPGVLDWMIAGHQSAEPAHKTVLNALRLKPLLNLDMCLGEGSGAAVALSIVRSALLLHGAMATFSQAGVSAKNR